MVILLVAGIFNDKFLLSIYLLLLLLLLMGGYFITSNGMFDFLNANFIFHISYLLAFFIAPIGIFIPKVSNVYLIYENQFTILSIAILWSIFGLLFYYLGFLSNTGTLLSKKIPMMELKVSPKILRLIVVCFTVFAIIAYYLLMQKLGGVMYVIFHLGVIRGLRILAFGGVGYLTIWLDFLVIISFILHIWSIKNHKKSKLIWVHSLIVLLLIGFCGSRMLILRYILGILIIYNYSYKKLNFKQILYFALCFLILSQTYVAFRYDFRSFKDWITSFDKILTSIFGDISAIRVFARVLQEVPSRYPYLIGKTYLDALINLLYLPFPRTIFKDKPIILSIGDYVGKTFFPEYPVGLPPTILGEAYLNFSYAGIFFEMFLFGIFCKFLTSLSRRYKEKGSVYVIILALFIPDIFVTVIAAPSIAFSTLSLNFVLLLIVLSFITILESLFSRRFNG